MWLLIGCRYLLIYRASHSKRRVAAGLTSNFTRIQLFETKSRRHTDRHAGKSYFMQPHKNTVAVKCGRDGWSYRAAVRFRCNHNCTRRNPTSVLHHHENISNTTLPAPVWMKLVPDIYTGSHWVSRIGRQISCPTIFTTILTPFRKTQTRALARNNV